MGGIWKLAARNVWRNRRRSLITMAAISLGLAMMIWGRNLNAGSYDEMVSVGVSQMAGHVVVQYPGWQEDRDRDQLVVSASAVSEKLSAEFPDATVVSRAFLSGLLTSPNNSVGIGLNAVQPSGETLVADWEEKLTDGEWLQDDDARGILVGVGVADTLQVELGDKVVFMTQGADEVTSKLFRVRGLLKTGSKELDGFFALATLPAAQELLEQDDVAHQVSVHLPNPKDSEAAALQAQALFPGQDLVVMNWMDAIPEIYQLIQMDQQYNILFMFIIGLIVAVGVANTVLMAVMERVKEFGVLLAVGMSPKRLAAMVVTEGTVLGLLSVALGVALGAVATYPIYAHGWDLTAAMGESYEMSGVAISAVLFAKYDWAAMALFATGGVVMTVLATLYPAAKAARLEPVEAMSHV
jgi:ABC-type lipoprotein release transport system permease subunit